MRPTHGNCRKKPQSRKGKRQGRLFLRHQVGRTDDGSPEVLRGREPEENFSDRVSYMIADKRPTVTRTWQIKDEELRNKLLPRPHHLPNVDESHDLSLKYMNLHPSFKGILTSNCNTSLDVFGLIDCWPWHFHRQVIILLPKVLQRGSFGCELLAISRCL